MPEVARALGIPEGTAYTRLRAARAELTAAVRRLQQAERRTGMSELEPLDDDLLALVGAAKPVPELSGARKAELFEATAAKIGAHARRGGGERRR